MSGNRLNRIVEALVIAFIILTQASYALDPQRHINHYVHDKWGLEDGLPSSGITAVTQTREGYLWLGIWAAVVRFDGVRFEVYDKRKVERLPYDFIGVLYEDSKGNLWIGTSGDNLFCKKGEKFISYSIKDELPNEGIRAIGEDRQGNIWLGALGAGLKCFNPKDETVTSYTSENGLLSHNVRTLNVDREGSLWIGTDEGLNVLNTDNGKITKYSDNAGLLDCKIFSIHEDRNGSLWIGTEKGLNRLDTADGALTQYTTDDGLAGDKVYTIIEDRDRNLWVVTGLGANRLNPADGRITSNIRYDGLPIDENLCICEDRESSLWFGTQEGLYRMKDGKLISLTIKDGLSDDYVWTVYEDRAGNLWVGTEDGLNRCDPHSGDVKIYTSENGLSNNRVYSICGDQNGTMWIGTDEGLNCLKDGWFTIYKAENGLVHNTVFAVYIDKKGGVWIGTEAGLSYLKDGKFTPYTTGDESINVSVFAIREDGNGDLWIGTMGGLIRLSNGEIKRYTTRDGLSENSVICIYDDGVGSLWLGTYNGGLNRLKNGRFESIGFSDGLCDDIIVQILEDDNNNLWISCSKGIFRVKKGELEEFFAGKLGQVTCEVYNERDGMMSRESTGGTQPSGWKSRDGKLRFTTVKGVVMIDPNNIKKNLLPPPVVVEKLVVDKNTILPPFNPNSDELVIPPGAKAIEIHYTGLSLLIPERVQFQYKLDGYDKDWQDVGTRRTAYFSTLPPGDYTFRVKACNNDNVWNETGASFSFHVNPLFHQTTWFYLLIALAVLAMGYTGYRFRVRQLKEKEKVLSALVDSRTKDLKERNIDLEKARKNIQQAKEQIEEKNLQLEEQSEKLKELDKAKSRFFANISHEFRTPLTLLIGPLEQMISACGINEAERKRKLILMLRNSQRLLRLINQLLELSRLDSGKMKLMAVKTGIVAFIRGLTDSFQMLSQQKELDLVFQAGSEDEEISLFMDQRKMEDIMSNLLINALKFTPAGGKVTVSVKANPSKDDTFPEGFVEISVTDTGPGIPAEQMAHIFDRFYTAGDSFENTQSGSGAGIGLALTKELVELHHGTITESSREGHGTTFTVRLPMGKTHLPEDEIMDSPLDQTGDDHPVSMDNMPIDLEDENGEGANEIQLGTAPEQANIILVVEDSADMREYIKSALVPGYTVIEAVNGKEGIEKARAIIPDLIISDIMMPEMDGYEMSRTLKSDIRTSHIPIILLTAKASEENILEGLETGADDYVTKPFSTKILGAKIKNLIDVRSQLQANINRELTLKPVKTTVSKMDSEFLRDLQGVIKENLSDPEFNVEELCKKLYMSNTTLYRKIQALCGQTPTEFIRSCRLKRALQLLQNGFGSVTEVAFEVGFSSRAYFTKCFKEKFHQLPSNFQESQ